MTKALNTNHLEKSSCCDPNLPGTAWLLGTGAEDKEPEGGLLGELMLEKVLQEESILRRRSQARCSDLNGGEDQATPGRSRGRSPSGCRKTQEAEQG